MNISYRWLQQLAPTINDSAEAAAEKLTYTAVPVDEVVWLGHGLEELVVARVSSVDKHPQADRLVICKVDAGRDQPVQVVTGAPVVVEGGYYPFVGAGQTLPGNVAVKKAKLRGEVSEGMLCSEKELGIGRDADGIMLLQGEFRPGQSLLEALELDDHRLDVDVTTNRPDLLGHLGVARELAPGGVDDVRLPDFPGHVAADYATETVDNEGVTGGITVRIEDPEGCPRYMGAVIRGVTIAPSPAWLANRLRAIGQQPINNVVDATNYVLHELNQPIHAFDLHKLGGSAVVIRRAKKRETLRTLDGKERKLDPEMLVIADAKVPSAMAGLMGGENSEVDDDTKDVFIECAYFDPKRVRKAAKGLDLDTDASYRFQRGMDREGLPRAVQRVVDLILTTAGGQVDGAAVDVYPNRYEPLTLTLRPSRVSHLLGLDLDRETIRSCLEPIGFSVKETGDDLAVLVPSWRPDAEREVDLIEEVARRFGYDKFPDEMRTFRPTSVPEDAQVEVVRQLRERMIGFGFLEAMTNPFVPSDDGEIKLLNPLSEREDHLRRDLLTELIHRVEYNLARGQRDIRLFEIGTAFTDGGDPLPTERSLIAAVWTGNRRPAHWSEESQDWDVWDLKAIFASAAAAAAPGAEVRSVSSDVDDGQPPPRMEQLFALVTPDGQTVGSAGRIAAQGLDVPKWAGRLWCFELAIESTIRQPTRYQALPVYPAVDRDLALLVPVGTLSADVEAVIRDAAPGYLEWLTVFDVYEGDKIPVGTRSIAYRLRFRSPDRTLTDEGVDSAVQRITAALKEKLNVGIRGA
jgi:phenylalanyl-tRNA synthetase beta chain